MLIRRSVCTFWALMILPLSANAFELEPLTVRNLSPAVIGYGLPPLDPARLLPANNWRLQATFDLASNFTESYRNDENLRFDGETYRLALSATYGLGSDLELGAELPLISHQGGFLDGFIEGWHDTFGLPQGGRDQAPRDRLDYSYAKQGGNSFSRQSSTNDIGDLALRAAWQCWQNQEHNSSLALRVSLKLPTGSDDRITGSGSTDLALWLSGEQRRQTDNGALLLYGGGGALLTTDGDLLPDQRRNLAGMLSLGLGWQPWPRLGLQVQFDGHSPLHKDSNFKELDQVAGQLAMGGSFALGEATAVELAVTEDVIVDTAPDVVFHLALKHQF